MSDPRWDRIQELFHAAAPLEAEPRDSFLRSACAGDDGLRREVESLLACQTGGSLYLEDARQEIRRLAAGAGVEEGAYLGPYKIERLLGRGGMGVVYQAVRDDGQYRMKVAIKVIGAGLWREDLQERFRVERQILATLEHPGIARLLDAGSAPDGAPYLVLEFVDGVPITEYARARPLSIRDRLELFRAVCAAVQHAHNHLVVHRDLKPSNILVTADGAPKLLDFGVAKLLQAAGGQAAAGLTRPLQRIMTPEYASPEQVRGEAIATATDVYSMGVLLYELLAGQRPYQLEGLRLTEVERVVCEQDPEPPGAVLRKEGAELDPDLDNIVLLAMRKEPGARYSTVERLSDDVRLHLQGFPVRARPATVRYRVGKFVRRHKFGAAAAALLVTSLVGGLVTTRLAQREAEAARSRAQLRLEQALQFANTLLFEIHDSVSGLPGATTTRRLIVQRAVEHLDRLAQESGADPAVQALLASGYERLSEVQFRRAPGHLGDSEGALASVRKALGLRQSALTVAPGNAEARRLVAADFRRLADIQNLTRDLASAARSAGQALAIYRTLEREAPNDRRRRFDLGQTLMAFGEILRRTGAINESLDHLRQALEIREGLLAERPEDLQLRRDVIATTLYICDVLRDDAGDRSGASAMLERALAMAKGLPPGIPETARSQADAAHALGENLKSAGDYSGALRAYREAEEKIAGLARADPADARLLRSLAIHGTNAALMLEKLGRFAEAEQRFRRSLAIHQRLLDRDPRNALSGGDLAFVHTALGALLLRRGQPAPAREALANAVQIQSRLRAEDPNNVEYAGNLGRAHALLGQALDLVKEPAQACESYRRGRDALSGAAGKFAPDVSPELLNRKLAGCERAANR